MIKLRPAIEICKRTMRGPVRGAEIGVLGGGHACTMLREYADMVTLHLIDSYGGITDADPKFVEFKERFAADKNRIIWHIMTSLDAAQVIPDHSLDFVYIDANHRYDSVSQDIRAWLPKVYLGGVLCGHDYFSHSSVKKAVDDWAKETNNYIFSTYPDWWVFID